MLPGHTIHTDIEPADRSFSRRAGHSREKPSECLISCPTDYFTPLVPWGLLPSGRKKRDILLFIPPSISPTEEEERKKKRKLIELPYYTILLPNRFADCTSLRRDHSTTAGHQRYTTKFVNNNCLYANKCTPSPLTVVREGTCSHRNPGPSLH